MPGGSLAQAILLHAMQIFDLANKFSRLACESSSLGLASSDTCQVVILVSQGLFHLDQILDLVETHLIHLLP